MKIRVRPNLLLAAGLLSPLTAAVASGGFHCESAGKDPLSLHIVTGHAVAPIVAQVTLREGGRTWSTADGPDRIAILQSWIDEKELRLDLVDSEVTRYEARLRIPAHRGLKSTGTLERGARTVAVRCTGEQ